MASPCDDSVNRECDLLIREPDSKKPKLDEESDPKPDSKKPKLDEESDSGEEIGFESDSSNDYDNEELKLAYRKYREQIKATDGFEVDPMTCEGVLCVLAPLDLKVESKKTLCTTAVKNAIALENQKKGTQLEFEGLVKSMWCHGFVFFATFDARDLSTNTVQRYEASVRYRVCYDETEVDIFRPQKVANQTN